MGSQQSGAATVLERLSLTIKIEFYKNKVYLRNLFIICAMQCAISTYFAQCSAEIGGGEMGEFGNTSSKIRKDFVEYLAECV